MIGPRPVVVTGASSGIGAACVKVLAQEGLTPIPMVRKDRDLDDLATQIGFRPFGLVADVTDRASLLAAADMLKEELGPHGALFGLVNNAGVAPPGPLMFQDFDQWQHVMDVNCFGVVRCMQAFGPLLGVRDDHGHSPGRVVNITSIAGQVGWPYLSAYSASKHAVEALSDSARRELIPYGVDVIIVGPGAVKTPIWGKANQYDLSRYDGSPYAGNLAKFVRSIEKDGEKGLDADVIGRVVLRALTVRNPKPRYAPVPNPLFGWLLPRFLPKRWLDALMARALGFHRPSK